MSLFLMIFLTFIWPDVHFPTITTIPTSYIKKILLTYFYLLNLSHPLDQEFSPHLTFYFKDPLDQMFSPHLNRYVKDLLEVCLPD
jgi:hypothetical protein